MTGTVEDTTDHRHRRRSALVGAVDWQLAARTGAVLVPSGPRIDRISAHRVVRELSDAAVRAEEPVREVSGLTGGGVVPPAHIVDRPGWISAAAESMSQLALPHGTAGAGSEVEQSGIGRFTGKPAGIQVGGILAFLSTAILGQYDPFAAEDGELLLVAPNIVAVERSLGCSPTDFRMWVCLHEVTHRVQFSSAPWLADYMKQAVSILGDVGEERFGDMVSRLFDELSTRRHHDTSSANGFERDPAEHGVLGLLRAVQAPPQREALDRLLALGTLLEGHADHVMDAVGPAVVPSVTEIREAFDQRRQRPTNPLQRLLRALLGVDAKVTQYVRGKAFVDAVVETVGMDRFNVVWSEPDTLPRPQEIGAPGRWIDRVLG